MHSKTPHLEKVTDEKSSPKENPFPFFLTPSKAGSGKSTIALDLIDEKELRKNEIMKKLSQIRLQEVETEFQGYETRFPYFLTPSMAGSGKSTIIFDLIAHQELHAEEENENSSSFSLD